MSGRVQLDDLSQKNQSFCPKTFGGTSITLSIWLRLPPFWPQRLSTGDVLAHFSYLLLKRGQNRKNAIYRFKSISTPQILDMLSNEVISTWKHIQKSSTDTSTSIFDPERENPILAVLAYMAHMRVQCQKNFGLKINFFQWPNYGFNTKSW